MSLDNIYLYGALVGNCRDGLDEISAGGGRIKLDCVSQGELSVVFSEVPGDFHSRSGRKGFIEWMIFHHQVLNYLHSRSKVIPFKAGTTVSGIDALLGLMEGNSSLLTDLLRKIEVLDEWNIAISFTDMQKVLHKAGEHPEIKKLKEEIQKKELITREDLIPVGIAIQGIVNEWKKQVASRVVSEIKSITNQIYINDVLDEDTLISLALLTTRAGADQAEDFLNGFPEEENLTARLVGPMPPHSFYTMEVKFIGREDLAEALDTLEITGIPNHRDLVKAKRSILNRIHPDKGPEDGDRPVQSVLRSFNLLDQYYRHKNYRVDKLEDAYMLDVANYRENDSGLD